MAVGGEAQNADARLKGGRGGGLSAKSLAFVDWEDLSLSTAKVFCKLSGIIMMVPTMMTEIRVAELWTGCPIKLFILMINIKGTENESVVTFLSAIFKHLKSS